MAETPSNMIALGSVAPDFCLPCPLTQKKVTLRELESHKATVIMFICNHCPYVLHILDKLVAVSNEYKKQGVSFVAINSNDIVHYPQDSPKKMVELIHKHDIKFPYLFDGSQIVAKAYHAACTPDFFVFNDRMRCVYRGRFDAATPGNDKPVTGEELTAALDSILAGEEVNPEQRPSLGCNIKWK